MKPVPPLLVVKAATLQCDLMTVDGLLRQQVEKPAVEAGMAP